MEYNNIIAGRYHIMGEESIIEPSAAAFKVPDISKPQKRKRIHFHADKETWLAVKSNCSITTRLVYLLVSNIQTKVGKNEFFVLPKTLKWINISRKTFRRSLDELEAWKVVQVEHKRGRYVKVKMLERRP